jgi:hypothetical protein
LIGDRIEQNIAKLEQEKNELARKMTERVERGGYDLSKINEADRWTVASRYCEVTERTHELGWEIRYLKEAIRLGEEWRAASWPSATTKTRLLSCLRSFDAATAVIATTPVRHSVKSL